MAQIHVDKSGHLAEGSTRGNESNDVAYPASLALEAVDVRTVGEVYDIRALQFQQVLRGSSN